jgi:hypothetical protein
MTGGNPRHVWSIDLTNVQFYVTLIIGVAAVIGIAWTTNAWVSEKIFHDELDKFHEVAVPEIQMMIDSSIKSHADVAQLSYERDLGALKEQLAVIRQHTSDIDARFIRMEAKIDRLYYERFGDG